MRLCYLFVVIAILLGVVDLAKHGFTLMETTREHLYFYEALMLIFIFGTLMFKKVSKKLPLAVFITAAAGIIITDIYIYGISSPDTLRGKLYFWESIMWFLAIVFRPVQK